MTNPDDPDDFDADYQTLQQLRDKLFDILDTHTAARIDTTATPPL